MWVICKECGFTKECLEGAPSVNEPKECPDCRQLAIVPVSQIGPITVLRLRYRRALNNKEKT